MHAPRACLDYYSMGAEVRGQLVWSQTQVVKVPKIVTNYFFFYSLPSHFTDNPILIRIILISISPPPHTHRGIWKRGYEK